MKINEFYEPSNDKEAMRSEEDTRKSKLTLKELNKHTHIKSEKSLMTVLIPKKHHYNTYLIDCYK